MSLKKQTKTGQRPNTHHHVFYVIGTHPSPSGHGSERGVQTVHVEEKRTVITLNQRSHPAAPVKREKPDALCNNTDSNETIKEAFRLRSP